MYHIAYSAIASANRLLVIITHPIKYVRTAGNAYNVSLWLSVNYAIVLVFSTCCAGNEMAVVLCSTVHTPWLVAEGRGTQYKAPAYCTPVLAGYIVSAALHDIHVPEGNCQNMLQAFYCAPLKTAETAHSVTVRGLASGPSCLLPHGASALLHYPLVSSPCLVGTTGRPKTETGPWLVHRWAAPRRGAGVLCSSQSAGSQPGAPDPGVLGGQRAEETGAPPG